jgi:hypothetical protein
MHLFLRFTEDFERYDAQAIVDNTIRLLSHPSDNVGYNMTDFDLNKCLLLISSYLIMYHVLY